jgi:Tfp pilus assembly protein PilX
MNERSLADAAKPISRSPSRHLRRGAAMAAVLVCLLVVALVGAALVKRMVSHHRQLRQHHRQLQAFWLAESGVERAAARLAASSEYEGESWRIAADAMEGAADAVVTVRVERIAEAPKRRAISVTARYPDDPFHAVVQRKKVLLDLDSR